MTLRCVLILAGLAAGSSAFAEPAPAPLPPPMITAQGLQYAVPDGWRLERYRPDKAAVLKHEATGAQLLVARAARIRKPPAPAHTERTGNGRTLRWGYAAESMDGQVILGREEVRLTIMSADLSRMPSSVGVPAMRRVADTARVVAPPEVATRPAGAAAAR